MIEKNILNKKLSFRNDLRYPNMVYNIDFILHSHEIGVAYVIGKYTNQHTMNPTIRKKN
jgi:hypothetical protein